MSLFIVDRETCKRDGICVAECPVRIIALDGDGFPVPQDGADERCINCGHCVAVCPTASLTLKTMAPDDCQPVRRDLRPSMEQVREWVLSRRSIREYKPRPVEKDLLAELIDVARYAPTGSNLQPVRWLVVERPDRVHRLAGLVVDWMRDMVAGNKAPRDLLDRMARIIETFDSGYDYICRGAPHMVLAHGPADLPATLPACIIALTTLELLAPAYGLGACWAGYFNSAAQSHAPLIEALGMPDGHQTCGALMIGYPKYAYHRIPLRNQAVIDWR
ncbi:MAG: nitroreductase family protein [Proteobacteria bacterium]|nr:nitroreductase family protein [Pseudomonadota bacterium]